MHSMGFRICGSETSKLLSKHLSTKPYRMPRKGAWPRLVTYLTLSCYEPNDALFQIPLTVARRMLLHSAWRGGPPTSPQVQPALGHELAARKGTGPFRRRVTRQELAGPGLNFLKTTAASQSKGRRRFLSFPATPGATPTQAKAVSAPSHCSLRHTHRLLDRQMTRSAKIQSNNRLQPVLTPPPEWHGRCPSIGV